MDDVYTTQSQNVQYHLQLCLQSSQYQAYCMKKIRNSYDCTIITVFNLLPWLITLLTKLQ